MARHEYVRRICDEELAFQLECAGAVVVQGPKWCGKTRTSEEIAKSVIKLQDPLKKKEYHQIAQTMPSVLLEGRSPRLIDEWQDEPDLWNLVRATVDERGGAGHFIFAVNLNSLSLTLDQFNAAASGKYNIGRINQGRRNVNKLATSAELYGNASPETLASRAKTRDKVNAQTESNRKISKADKTVGSLLDIMQYEGGRTLGHTVAGQAKDG